MYMGGCCADRNTSGLLHHIHVYVVLLLYPEEKKEWNASSYLHRLYHCHYNMTFEQSEGKNDVEYLHQDLLEFF